MAVWDGISTVLLMVKDSLLSRGKEEIGGNQVTWREFFQRWKNLAYFCKHLHKTPAGNEHSALEGWLFDCENVC